MSNNFYNHGSYPASGAAGSSATMRAELDSIAAGFDKLPALTGNGSKLVAINSGGTAMEAVSAYAATGWTINNSVIGGTTPAAGTFTTITATGNITLTGTGNRITGDFSNATAASRVMFQTSTTNGATYLSALPNGSSSAAGVIAWGGSDTLNASYGSILMNGTALAIGTDKVGTGTYLPMTFSTGGSERMRIDTSGNVGIGVSPGAKLHVYNSASPAANVEVARLSYVTSGSSDGHGAALNFTNESNSNLARISTTYVAAETGTGLGFWTQHNGLGFNKWMSIMPAGNVGIGVTPTSRNNTRLQIVDGIGFPATQVASSDANTLDDYEQGTWTPSVGGTATYNANTGRYVKIGNNVYITGYLYLNAIGTGSTSVISGLPFTVANANGAGSFAIGYWASLTTGEVYVGCQVNPNATTIQLYSTNAAAVSLGTNAIIGNNTQLMFSGHYTTDL